MKLAITSMGDTLDSKVDPRFGRAAYFIVGDSEIMDFTIIKNENVAGSGVGISSAKLVIDAGAKAVLTGNCGPNAERTLSAAGVNLYTGVSGIVADAIECFKDGKLPVARGPNVEPHSGMSP